MDGLAIDYFLLTLLLLKIDPWLSFMGCFCRVFLKKESNLSNSYFYSSFPPSEIELLSVEFEIYSISIALF